MNNLALLRKHHLGIRISACLFVCCFRKKQNQKKILPLQRVKKLLERAYVCKECVCLHCIDLNLPEI